MGFDNKYWYISKYYYYLMFHSILDDTVSIKHFIGIMGR